MSPWSINSQVIQESRDGSGAGDHDVEFVFGRTPRALAPFPFSTRELARLMILRSRLQAEGLQEEDYA